MNKLLFYKNFCKRFYRWYDRETGRYDFHEIILKITEKFEPADNLLLALEYPHTSVNDPNRVAYTRSMKDGENDRQTVTSFGKYVRRHFPSMKDHEIRDFAEMNKGDVYEIWDTLEDIVRTVQEGPRSCMQWDNSYDPPNRNWKSHPYVVYSPEYHWKVAVRLHPENRQILGRCLINSDVITEGVFVRSYRKAESYSHSDEGLEFWLKQQGIEHVDAWPDGTRLNKLEAEGDGPFLAPYIDGDTQSVDDHGSYLRIIRGGEYECTETNGTPNYTPEHYCECCGDYVDSVQYVRQYGDVCEGCISDSFMYGYVGNGRQDYIYQDYAIEVDGDYYHQDCLDEYDIVYDYHGEYRHRDDVNYCESDGEYYDKDCDDIAFCEFNHKFYDKSEMIEVNDLWYHQNVDPEVIYSEREPEMEKEAA